MDLGEMGAEMSFKEKGNLMRKLRWGICQYREGVIGVEEKKEKDLGWHLRQRIWWEELEALEGIFSFFMCVFCKFVLPYFILKVYFAERQFKAHDNIYLFLLLLLL